MLNERKFTYDYFKKIGYSDFQFLGSWDITIKHGLIIKCYNF